MAESDETPSPATRPSPNPAYIRPRREPFEHGLLPIPKLIFTDGTQTLGPIKDKLLSLSSEPTYRVNPVSIAESLQISPDHARLVLETIACVLHSVSDPLVTANPSEIGSVGVNVFDLIVFLYIQSYKRLLPKGHKDSAAVADVWPSTSAFDGFLSALSPLQLVRSNSRRNMPSQSDEEAHQLSYLQKHLGNILSLLSESVEGDGEDSLVLSAEKFEHLGFLFYFGENGSERIPLSQNAPFFANSDPNMPAVPVPAAQVHDWLLQNIASAMERITERASARENGPTSATDQDVPMTDVSASSVKSSLSPRGPNFIEGISKASYVRKPNDLKGSSVKVVNCHESVLYILAPLRYATVYGCSDATIVLGAVGKAVRVEHCERVHVIAAAKRICIANCRECVFFLGVNQTPLVVGDNHKLQLPDFHAIDCESMLLAVELMFRRILDSGVRYMFNGFYQVAPYNTFYPQLEEHLNGVGVDPAINKWDEPVALGVVDPHDSLSHPAGVSDVQTESTSHVDPDQFTNFLIPNWSESEQFGSTKDNPFPLPEAYMTSKQRNQKNLEDLKQILRESDLEESRKKELTIALHGCFKDWLYASGNIRQLYFLQND